MSHNPYSPPTAAVEDARPLLIEGTFVPDGRRRPIGHGWEWIAAGWALFRRQTFMWVISFILFYAIVAVLAFVPFARLAGRSFGPLMAAGFMAMADKAHRHEQFTL